MKTSSPRPLKGAGTLAKYEPTFVLDDGFRLTSEPTLDALANDINKLERIALAGADTMILAAFLCGVSLLKAKDIVPAAPRGASGKGYNRDGFDAWKRRTFGERRERSLQLYMQFARAVFRRVHELSKTATVAVLEHPDKTVTVSVLSSHRDFVMPDGSDGRAELMRQLGETLEGKSLTEFVRAWGRVREALDPAESGKLRGDGEHPTKAQKAHEEQVKWVSGEWGSSDNPGRTRKRLLRWLAPDPIIKVKPYHLLPDAELEEFAGIVHDLHREITDLRAKRRAERTRK